MTLTRLATVVLVLLAGATVWLTAWDPCVDDGEACLPGCHLGCRDGCATAPLSTLAAADTDLPLLGSFALAAGDRPLTADARPELSPPRA